MIPLFAFNAVADSGKWWEKHDEGWFFYQDPPPELTRVPVPQPDPTPTPIVSETPPPLATEIIKREGERLLSEAMVNPTDQNVETYMRFQKDSMELSERFAYIWQRLLMKYPDLYMAGGTEQKNDEIQRAVTRLGTQAGLFFIYSGHCPSCQQSVSTVVEFKSKYDGFTVMPITLDVALPALTDTKPDNGIAARLGVESVPAWFLAYPGEDRFEHIGTGHMPLSELERRLYRYVVTEDMGVFAANRTTD
jgi:conjugal transfer pilus assembly protein TraF